MRVVERIVADAALSVTRRAALRETAAVLILVGLRALPARRAVVGAEGGHAVEARAALLGETETALAFGHFDVCLRQFVKEARRNVGRPHAVGAAVGGEIDFRAAAGTGDADVRQAALLFEAGAALLVERALVRE